MNLLVIGSGGREHAICYKLRQSNRINQLFCLPGNAGTKKIAKNINQDISNFEEIYKIIKQNKIDIVIIGPEEPLVNGITDFLREKSVKVLGPSKFAAQLEGSKAFMKNLCKKNNIPTPRTYFSFSAESAMEHFENVGYPLVIKPIIGRVIPTLRRVASRVSIRSDDPIRISSDEGFPTR